MQLYSLTFKLLICELNDCPHDFLLTRHEEMGVLWVELNKRSSLI